MLILWIVSATRLSYYSFITLRFWKLAWQKYNWLLELYHTFYRFLPCQKKYHSVFCYYQILLIVLNKGLCCVCCMLKPLFLSQYFRHICLLKGSVFAQFVNIDDAKKFVEAESIKYEDTELKRLWRYGIVLHCLICNLFNLACTCNIGLQGK